MVSWSLKEGMVVLNAVISTIATAVSVREFLKRFPPRPSGALLDSMVLPDEPGLLALILPRTLRRLWTGALLILFSALGAALHVFVVLQFGDGDLTRLAAVVLYVASLPLAVMGVLLPLILWRGRHRAS